MDLTTEPEKMRESAATLEHSATAISRLLGQLEEASGTLTAAWQGEAKLAYESLYKRYREAAIAHAKALDDAAGALADLAELYDSADTRGAAAVPH